jgi:hypothetical protein
VIAIIVICTVTAAVATVSVQRRNAEVVGQKVEVGARSDGDMDMGLKEAFARGRRRRAGRVEWI